MKMALRKVLILGWSLALPAVSSATLTLSDDPLYLTLGVPPNVLINMSVETPMGGAAYADQPGNPTGCGVGSYATPRPNVSGAVGICYISTVEYLGYFDPKKCYEYSADRFIPSGNTNANHECSNKWSGNFLNWASMTAIDEFIWTMTGGNRIVDTTTETVIRRARKHHSNSWFPHKLINSAYNVAPSTVTPFADSSIYIYNEDFQLKVGTSHDGNQRGYFNVNVRVCDATQGLESNCVAYTSGGSTYYKPEGLIQKNSNKMRFALTSYTLDNAQGRDGGVLRSKMKFVGPTYPTTSGPQSNPVKEFGPDGILIHNPDGAGGGLNSGIINYINKFSDPGYKSYDPIGELFYESLRYFKNLGPTPEYFSGLTSAQYGGFEIVTNWDDPLQYSCQKNFIVGINDANPWLDKKLPGTFFTCDKAGTSGMPASFTANDCGEPSNADSSINVTNLTNTVGQLEGLNNTSWLASGTWSSGTASGVNDSVGFVPGDGNLNSCVTKTVTQLGQVMGTCPYPAKQNSYYIAGLAYYANTTDIRPDLAGKQTVTTFMIDTQEYSANPLDGPKNMLWLAGKYGGFIDENDNNEPDLTTEWDADGDGVPDNYVLATEPQKLVQGLGKTFSDILAKASSAAAIATNSTRLDTETFIYQARFNSGDWSGQLLAYPLTEDGTLGTMEWDAGTLIPAHGSRSVFTHNETAGAELNWADLSSTQQADLNKNSSGVVDGCGQERLSYLRGDQTNEGAGSFTCSSGSSISRFRARPISVLGDIVNSDPFYLKVLNFGYEQLPSPYTTEAGSYAAFRTANQNRAPVVYVGANDGMLHAFRADTGNTDSGKELFAYFPRTVIPQLSKLTDPNYNSHHKYFVDGSPYVADAYIAGGWKTVLVGTLGAGGKGLFALDVTNPASFGASNVLWEFDEHADDANSDGSPDGDLGYTFGQAQIAMLNNGQWVAIFGNGYNSTNDRAYLYVVNLATGALIRKIATDTATNNGLSTPVLLDTDGDRIVDYAYAGDLQGNMWKFDLTHASDPAHWDVAYKQGSTPKSLITVRNASDQVQPITAPPEIGVHPNGGHMIYFGTGQYIAIGDNGNTQVQTLYGVWDNGTRIETTDRSTLQAQTIIFEGQGTLPDGTTSSDNLRAISNHAVDWGTKRGWYLDLVPPGGTAQGERVVSVPLLRHGRAIFTTLIPSSDPCEYGGTSWIMEVDAVTGSRLAYSVFNVNKDAGPLFNEDDYIVVTINGQDVAVPASGLESTVGIIKPPAVVSAGSHEHKIASGTSGSLISIVEQGGADNPRTSWKQLQ